MFSKKELDGHPGWIALGRLKRAGCSGVVADYDGTLFGPGCGTESVARLIYEAAKKMVPVIATARGATFRRQQLKSIIEATRTNRLLKPVYISLGNGAWIDKVANGYIETIYDNSLTIDDTKTIIAAYQSLGIQLKPEDDAFRQKDLQFPWGDLLSPEYLELSQQSMGVWAEPIKLTLLFGQTTPEVLRKHHQTLSQALPRYQVSWGGKPVIDVSRKIMIKGKEIDGKLATAIFISELEDLSLDNIATFGDTPDGNDRALLELPYGFTNQEGYFGRPYSLPVIGLQAQRIYEAIYLLMT